jgi:hypothetical protein
VNKPPDENLWEGIVEEPWNHVCVEDEEIFYENLSREGSVEATS